MTEPIFSGFPEYQFYTEGFRPQPSGPGTPFLEWLLEVSGIQRAIFLPTGQMDLVDLIGNGPLPAADAPPPGRVRFRHRDGFLEVVDSNNVILWRANTPTPQAFLDLTDTPASYAGAAGQVVQVNAGATGLEFAPIAPSAGIQPLISYPGRWQNAGFPFALQEMLVHYPGFTVVNGSQTGVLTPIDGNLLGAKPIPDYIPFGRELDTTAGKFTTFIAPQPSAEDGVQVLINLHAAIPESFSGWNANGIRLRSRLAVGLTTDSVNVTLRLYDPVTNAIAFTATRVAGPALEAGYLETIIPPAALNALSFAGGDMLRVEIQLVHNFINDGAPTLNLGRMYVGWQ